MERERKIDYKRDLLVQREVEENLNKKTEPEEFFPDLFGDSPIPDIQPVVQIENQVEQSVEVDWDDSEGYLRYRIGEILDGRFRVIGIYGSGVFSSVIKGVDNQNNNEEVAIKIARNRPTFKEAAENESKLLQLVNEEPEKNRYIIRLISAFEYKKHNCLVLEPMGSNLRELIKTYGAKKGLSMTAVKYYSRQLLLALVHLKRKRVMHADIKPDNIVVSKDQKVVKLCDFGSGSMVDSPENTITPLLVSRFYRPPEVILGLPYDHNIDMWSVGCCIAEMYTGKILFSGRDNNEMLRLHMEIKGPFPKKMLKKGAFSSEHFDFDDVFLLTEEDVISKKPVTRRHTIKRTDILDILVPNRNSISSSELAEVRVLKDLLEKIFTLNPEKRISPEEALKHPFCKKK